MKGIEERLDHIEEQIDRIMDVLFGTHIANGVRDFEKGIFYKFSHSNNISNGKKAKISRIGRDVALGILTAVEAIRLGM